MPIYEYQCGGCDSIFEELMRLSDPDPACPDCGASEVRKLMSNTSFQLKGSGWYVTDYKSKNKSGAGKSAGSEGDGASESASASSGGSDSSDSSVSKSESSKKTSSESAKPASTSDA